MAKLTKVAKQYFDLAEAVRKAGVKAIASVIILSYDDEVNAFFNVSVSKDLSARKGLVISVNPFVDAPGYRGGLGKKLVVIPEPDKDDYPQYILIRGDELISIDFNTRRTSEIALRDPLVDSVLGRAGLAKFRKNSSAIASIGEMAFHYSRVKSAKEKKMILEDYRNEKVLSDAGVSADDLHVVFTSEDQRERRLAAKRVTDGMLSTFVYVKKKRISPSEKAKAKEYENIARTHARRQAIAGDVGALWEIEREKAAKDLEKLEKEMSRKKKSTSSTKSKKRKMIPQVSMQKLITMFDDLSNPTKNRPSEYWLRRVDEWRGESRFLKFESKEPVSILEDFFIDTEDDEAIDDYIKDKPYYRSGDFLLAEGVNAGGWGDVESVSSGLEPVIVLFEGRYMGENLAGDGAIVKPIEVIAYTRERYAPRKKKSTSAAIASVAPKKRESKDLLVTVSSKKGARWTRILTTKFDPTRGSKEFVDFLKGLKKKYIKDGSSTEILVEGQGYDLVSIPLEWERYLSDLVEGDPGDTGTRKILRKVRVLTGNIR